MYAVLEEDGTEVDEEEYFMMLEHRYYGVFVLEFNEKYDRKEHFMEKSII